MSARNSPFYAAGLKDGAADAARNPRVRRGFATDKARSWMYRRGFARGFLTIRELAGQRPLDDSPGTIAAMQRALDNAWASLEEVRTP